MLERSSRPQPAADRADSPTGPDRSCFAPRTWTVECIAPGERFHFDVILFQIDDPPISYFVRVFTELAGEGLGPGRGKALLERVEQVGLDGTAAELSRLGDVRPSSISLDADHRDIRRVEVHFVTPTELKSGSDIVTRPEFGVLLARIRDRVSTLRALYGDGPLHMDFAAFGERAEAVRIERCDLRHVHAERLSTRTRQRHPLGGLAGVVEYAGSLAEFVPFLEAAQFTGVGRQTSWGKGEIQVKLSPEPPAEDSETSR